METISYLLYKLSKNCGCLVTGVGYSFSQNEVRAPLDPTLVILKVNTLLILYKIHQE